MTRVAWDEYQWRQEIGVFMQERADGTMRVVGYRPSPITREQYFAAAREQYMYQDRRRRQ